VTSASVDNWLVAALLLLVVACGPPSQTAVDKPRVVKDAMDVTRLLGDMVAAAAAAGATRCC